MVGMVDAVHYESKVVTTCFFYSVTVIDAVIIIEDSKQRFSFSLWTISPNSLLKRMKCKSTWFVQCKSHVEGFVHRFGYVLQWETPKNLLKMFADNKIWLPPPQCYELLRLCHINDIDKVVNFAKSRNNKGITLQFPIYYEATDGAVFAYPGETECSR